MKPIEVKIKIFPGGQMPEKKTTGTCKNNCICPICGKLFHVKPSELKKRKWEPCCSRECGAKLRHSKMQGKGNHQYGLRGANNSSYKGYIIPRKNGPVVDQLVLIPGHPFARSDGRVKLHRFIVEQNYKYFSPTDFVIIGGKHYLKPGLCVHHINEDHDDNAINNLMVVTSSQHRRIHNKLDPRLHDKHNGKFLKRGAGGFGSTGKRG